MSDLYLRQEALQQLGLVLNGYSDVKCRYNVIMPHLEAAFDRAVEGRYKPRRGTEPTAESSQPTEADPELRSALDVAQGWRDRALKAEAERLTVEQVETAMEVIGKVAQRVEAERLIALTEEEAREVAKEVVWINCQTAIHALYADGFVVARVSHPEPVTAEGDMRDGEI